MMNRQLKLLHLTTFKGKGVRSWALNSAVSAVLTDGLAVSTGMIIEEAPQVLRILRGLRILNFFLVYSSKEIFYVFSALKIIFIGGYPHLLCYILPNPCN